MTTEKIDHLLASIESKNERLTTSEARYGLFFVFVILSLSINDVLVLFASYFHFNVLSAGFNWLSSIIYFVVTFLFMLRLGLHYSDFGVTFKNAKQSIVETVTIMAILIALAVIVIFTGHKLFGWKLAPYYAGLSKLWGIDSVLYLVHVVLQEVGYRGLYVGSLYRFMGRLHPVLILILSSLVFGVLHAHFGLIGFLAAFSGSVLFGYLYLRHKNLIGAIIAHYVLGLVLFTFIL